MAAGRVTRAPLIWACAYGAPIYRAAAVTPGAARRAAGAYSALLAERGLRAATRASPAAVPRAAAARKRLALDWGAGVVREVGISGLAMGIESVGSQVGMPLRRGVQQAGRAQGVQCPKAHPPCALG